MATKDSSEGSKVAAEVNAALDRALIDALRESPDVHTQEKISRRRWFGMALLSLATFCLLVGVAPWPNKQIVDLPMWAGFAVILLVVGGWQLNKASTEAAAALQTLDDIEKPATVEGAHRHLRRLK